MAHSRLYHLTLGLMVQTDAEWGLYAVQVADTISKISNLCPYGPSTVGSYGPSTVGSRDAPLS